jgi:hypothetical protein
MRWLWQHACDRDRVDRGDRRRRRHRSYLAFVVFAKRRSIVSGDP